jgi:osmotically-inducible protein OsmY
VKKNKLYLYGLLLGQVILSSSLSACSTVALTVTDPRSIATTTDDQYTMRDLQFKYMNHDFESDHIQITVYNHEALLNGQVINHQHRENAVNLAKSSPNINHVYDYLYISSNYSSTSMSDTAITAGVKTALFGSSDINSNDVKIVTNNGEVFILGIIDKQQLEKMIKTAYSVDGVKKVIPLVHYKSSDSKFNW